jgi:hypothetical protein
MSNQVLIAYNSITVGVVCSQITISKLKKLGVDIADFGKTKAKPISFRVVCDKYICNATGLDYKTLKSLARITE